MRFKIVTRIETMDGSSCLEMRCKEVDIPSPSVAMERLWYALGSDYLVSSVQEFANFAFGEFVREVKRRA